MFIWQYHWHDVTDAILHFVTAMMHLIIKLVYKTRGPGSSVGVVTGYGLDGPGIESRWE
jgi:hypothetical protein